MARVIRSVSRAVSANSRRTRRAVFIVPEGTQHPSGRHFDIGQGCLFTDVEGGIADLVTHLYATGRTKISYVAGPPISSDRIRRESIGVAIERLGFEPRVRAYAHPASWAEYLRTVELVERERPEALVCYDDQVALTLMSALRERGIRVPEDVAVTGFDDIPFARIAHPRLTTVAQPTEAMGARAATMLLEAIESGTLPRSETMAVELIVRESTRAASAAVTDP
jgi:LacI family transcriptional regulator, galactose operon repressor